MLWEEWDSSEHPGASNGTAAVQELMQAFAEWERKDQAEFLLC